MRKIKYTEAFFSIQGEGMLTGRMSRWLRTFGCNLDCKGFGQPVPEDSATWAPMTQYLMPLDDIKRYDEIPLFKTGCDSSHSVHHRFKHLAQTINVGDDLNQVLCDLVPGSTHEDFWYHPRSKQTVDLTITGGEPLLWDRSLADMIMALPVNDGMGYPYLCFETNGTRLASEHLKKAMLARTDLLTYASISPKLLTVAGEVGAWDYEKLMELAHGTFMSATLKVVVSHRDEAWREFDHHMEELYKRGFVAEVYVMPVGASREDQSDVATLTRITENALARGFNVSGRLHTILFGNDQNGR